MPPSLLTPQGVAIDQEAVPVEKRSLLQRLIGRAEFSPLVLLVVEIVAFWLINHDFLSIQNISNTLAFTVNGWLARKNVP